MVLFNKNRGYYLVRYFNILRIKVFLEEIEMKRISYVSLVLGILLIGIEFIFKFDGMIGYIVTLIAVLLTLLGALINEKIRMFLGDLFINFF